jgi:PilX N-terminal
LSAGIRGQDGATLVIALIMLAVISLLAASSLGTTSMNLKVVGNMQSRGEALHAAQQAIETVISTPQFIADPANAVPDPCGAANTLCTDLDGDGAPEYITRLDPAPTCIAVRMVKASELNLSSVEDLSCAAGPAQQSGVANGESWCAETAWDITAETRSTFSRTKVTVTQGIAVRVGAAQAEALCGASPYGVAPGSAQPLPRQAGSMVRTGGARRSAGAHSPTGPQAAPPVIAQRRMRTYWYVHGDQ